MDSFSLVILFLLFFILSFFCLSENIKSLKASAQYGFVAIILMIGTCLMITLVNSASQLSENDWKNKQFNFFGILKHESNEIVNRIAIIVLSFSFQTYTFSLYDSLQDRSPYNMMVSTSYAVVTSTLCYIIVGAILYLNYGESVLEYESALILLSKTKFGFLILFLFSVNILMSFPISFFSVKSYTLFVIQLAWDKVSTYHKNYKNKSKESKSQVSHLQSNERKSEINHEDKIDPSILEIPNNDKTVFEKLEQTMMIKDERLSEKNDHHQNEEFSWAVRSIISTALFGLTYFICYKYGNSKYVS